MENKKELNLMAINLHNALVAIHHITYKYQKGTKAARSSQEELKSAFFELCQLSSAAIDSFIDIKNDLEIDLNQEL